MTLTETPARQLDDTASTEALIREARRRQWRRRVVIAVVLLLVSATIAIVLASGGGSDSDSRSRAPDRRPPPSQSSPPSRLVPAPVPGQLSRPHSLAVDVDGSLLIVNEGTSQILRRRADGTVDVVAGTGVAGFSGDGGPATDAQIGNFAYGIAVANDGTIYFADTANNRVRAVSPDGTIFTIAGTGASQSSGDGGPAVLADVASPSGVAVAPDQSLFIATSDAIRRVDLDGTIETVIPGGRGALPLPLGPTYFGPSAVAVHGSGNIYAANFSPKQLIEFSPSGAILAVWDLYVSPGGLVGTPDGVIIANYGYSIDRIRHGELTTLFRFGRGAIPGAMAFRPLGVAVRPDGTIFAADIGGAGGNNVGVLIAFKRGSAAHVLETR